MESKNEKQELPMNWWKFWKYFRFPIGILFSLGSLGQYIGIDISKLNSFGKLIILLNCIMVLLLCITYISFLNRKEGSYKFFIAYLFIEPAWNTFTTVISAPIFAKNITEVVIYFLIIYGILYGTWIYPNSIYFKKRKKFFYKNKSKQLNNKSNMSENVIHKIKTPKEKNSNSEKCKREKNKKHGKNAVNEYIKLKIILIIFIALFIVSSVLALYFGFFYRKDEISELQNNITNLNKRKNELLEENKSLKLNNIATQEKIEFIDENIVFVIDGYGKYYYTYDQMEQVTQGTSFEYWAYNKEQAIGLGYRAWK